MADIWYDITGETCVQEFGGICRRLALPGGKGVLYILFKQAGTCIGCEGTEYY